jgi:hypothetical protein
MKLTLSIDESAIRAAKAYAQAQNKSLSALTEEFYKTLEEEAELSNTLKRWRSRKPVPDFDYKEMMADILTEKYK